MTSVQTNKQHAVDFLMLVTAGKIDEAYKKYVNVSGKHHNVWFPAGFPALLQAMKENDTAFPNKNFTIKHVLGDGNLVATHASLILKQGVPGMSVVHLFRFENGKIIEFWDCGQEIPAHSPNSDGAF